MPCAVAIGKLEECLCFISVLEWHFFYRLWIIQAPAVAVTDICILVVRVVYMGNGDWQGSVCNRSIRKRESEVAAEQVHAARAGCARILIRIRETAFKAGGVYIDDRKVGVYAGWYIGSRWVVYCGTAALQNNAVIFSHTGMPFFEQVGYVKEVYTVLHFGHCEWKNSGFVRRIAVVQCGVARPCQCVFRPVWQHGVKVYFFAEVRSGFIVPRQVDCSTDDDITGIQLGEFIQPNKYVLLWTQAQCTGCGWVYAANCVGEIPIDVCVFNIVFEIQLYIGINRYRIRSFRTAKPRKTRNHGIDESVRSWIRSKRNLEIGAFRTCCIEHIRCRKGEDGFALAVFKQDGIALHSRREWCLYVEWPTKILTLRHWRTRREGYKFRYCFSVKRVREDCAVVGFGANISNNAWQAVGEAKQGIALLIRQVRCIGWVVLNFRMKVCGGESVWKVGKGQAVQCNRERFPHVFNGDNFTGKVFAEAYGKITGSVFIPQDAVRIRFGDKSVVNGLPFSVLFKVNGVGVDDPFDRTVRSAKILYSPRSDSISPVRGL